MIAARYKQTKSGLMCRNLDMIELVGTSECNLSRRRCQRQHAGGVLIGSRRTDAVFLFTIYYYPSR